MSSCAGSAVTTFGEDQRPMMGDGEQLRQPVVSVICVFYNAEDFLAEAIESVLAQKYRSFELLVVDDGSTDRSSEIARGYVQNDPERVRYLQHEGGSNRGPGASRNRGLAAASGEYVAFIDADDRWLPFKLSQQLEIFELIPDADAVCGNIRHWRSWSGGDDVIVTIGHRQNSVIRPPEALLRMWPLAKPKAPSMSDLIVRRAAALRVGTFDESFVGDRRLYEDVTFLAKLYLAANLYVSDAVWSDYRQHDGSCVWQAARAGHTRQARYDYLRWLAEYVGKTQFSSNVAIRIALAREMLPHRVPWITTQLRPFARFVRALYGKRT